MKVSCRLALHSLLGHFYEGTIDCAYVREDIKAAKWRRLCRRCSEAPNCASFPVAHDPMPAAEITSDPRLWERAAWAAVKEAFFLSAVASFSFRSCPCTWAATMNFFGAEGAAIVNRSIDLFVAGLREEMMRTSTCSGSGQDGCVFVEGAVSSSTNEDDCKDASFDTMLRAVLNARGPAGQTPLAWASSRCPAAVLKHLLVGRATRGFVNPNNFSDGMAADDEAFDPLAVCGCEDCAGPRQDNGSPLYNNAQRAKGGGAAATKNKSHVHHRGLPANVKTWRDVPIVNIMFFFDDERVLCELISGAFVPAGADLDATDSEGNTALLVACMMQSAAVVRLLVSLGASTNAVVDRWRQGAAVKDDCRRLRAHTMRAERSRAPLVEAINAACMEGGGTRSAREALAATCGEATHSVFHSLMPVRSDVDACSGGARKCGLGAFVRSTVAAVPSLAVTGAIIECLVDAGADVCAVDEETHTTALEAALANISASGRGASGHAAGGNSGQCVCASLDIHALLGRPAACVTSEVRTDVAPLGEASCWFSDVGSRMPVDTTTQRREKGSIAVAMCLVEEGAALQLQGTMASIGDFDLLATLF